MAQLVPARPAWPGQNRFFAAAAPGIAPPGLAGDMIDPGCFKRENKYKVHEAGLKHILYHQCTSCIPSHYCILLVPYISTRGYSVI